MTEEESNAKCDAIRQIAYALHVYLGTGYLEKVYENGLAHRLSKAGFDVQTQVPVKVCDEDGFILGDYMVDMLVDGIVVELRATRRPPRLRIRPRPRPKHSAEGISNVPTSV